MARCFPYRLYFMFLCGVYLFLVFLFQSRLQIDTSRDQPSKSGYFTYQKIGAIAFSDVRAIDLKHGSARQLTNVKHGSPERNLSQSSVHYKLPQKDSCYKMANTKSFTYRAVQEEVFYTYSAYLDERLSVRLIRFIALILKSKKKKLSVKCKFKIGARWITQNATLYEMCENHNRKYGGHIITCLVPKDLDNACQFNVSFLDRETGKISPREVTLNVTRINHLHQPFDFGVCIPPIFGNIPKKSIAEFIELTRLFGAQHFIFYNYNITNDGLKELLDYYTSKGIVTVVPWKLPGHIEDRHIWYHGQLLAHNDCLYRAMSLMKIVSINDIDEYIVPHDGNLTWKAHLASLMTNKVIGLSFNSAFFDPQMGAKDLSGLMTVRSVTRSRLFSKIRTKVMVKPAKVFEVGIHHVSKPLFEGMLVNKVDVNIAYLHHYRKCVSNYGMKCIEFTQDKVIYEFNKNLMHNFNAVLENVKMQR